MTDNMPPENDLKGEFQNLADNLKQVLQTAWESDERKKLQTEIEAGLTQVASAMNEAFDSFKKSDVGEQFMDDIEDFGERVRSGEVEAKVRTDVTEALQKLNSELEKVVKPKTEETE
jgi:ElaB/YqjD/DUF883 family membrane-anchored ribosome-binding protein